MTHEYNPSDNPEYPEEPSNAAPGFDLDAHHEMATSPDGDLTDNFAGAADAVPMQEDDIVIKIPTNGELLSNAGIDDGLLPPLSPLDRDGAITDVPFLAFRQEFNGEQRDVPVEEQIAAGTSFANYVDAELTDGEVDEYGIAKGFGVSEDDQPIKVTIENKSIIDPSNPKRIVRLSGVHFDADGPRRTGHDAEYVLDIDGVVRRTDGKPETIEEHMDWLNGLQMLRDMRDNGGATEILLNYHTRDVIERELGLQNQPIGQAEVDALIKLLQSPRIP